MTYRFLSFISEKYLTHHFKGGFEGLMKLIFLTDKLLQKTNGLIWGKLYRGKVTSILFSVSCFLTIFTSQIKGEENYPTVYRIWDLFLIDGFLPVIKYMLYLLELQQHLIFKCDEGEMIFALKGVEAHPFSVMKFCGVNEKIIESSFRHLSKKKIQAYGIEPLFYKKLLLHYEMIHKPILNFWGERY